MPYQHNLRVLVYLVIHDSGWVSLEHLLLSWYPSHYLPGVWTGRGAHEVDEAALCEDDPSSEYGTYKTAKARIWL